MDLLRCLVVVMLSCLVAACGGGGGKSEGSTAASSSSVSGSNGSYSVSVDRSALKFDIQWDGTSIEQTVKVKFKGDGLVVGFPPDEVVDGRLRVDVINVTDNSADVVIGYGFGSLPDLEILQRKLRFVTGKADGRELAFVDVAVTIEQLDGFNVSGGALSLSGVWGAAPDSMEFFLSTARLGWTVTSDLPGLTIEPAAGTGAAKVKISYNFRDTPVNAKSATITFSAANGTEVDATIELALQSPVLNATPNLPDFTAPHLSSGSAQVASIPVSFTQETAALDVNWSATLPAWLSADRQTGKTGKDELTLSVNSLAISSLEDGVYSGTVDITAEVLGQPVVQQVPVTLHYEKYRLQATRQAYAFADYGTQDTHSGSIVLNSSIADAGMPLQITLTASANQSWVVIDSVSNNEVRFHLNPAGLSEGAHIADIEVAANNNPFVVNEKVKIGYYKTAAPVTPAAPFSVDNNELSLITNAAQTLPDKLRPRVYAADGNNRISVFDVARQEWSLLFEVDANVKLGSLAVSADGQYLYFVGNNATLYQFDTLSQSLVGAVNTDLPYDGMVDSNHFPLNFHRVNGKSILSLDDQFYDANTGAALTLVDGWRNFSYNGLVVAPDSGVGFFTIDKGVFCGEAKQINVQFSHATDQLSFMDHTRFPDEFCGSGYVALSAGMNQFAVNRRAPNIGRYINVFGFESVIPGELQVTKLAELDVGFNEVQALALSSLGTLTVAQIYVDSDFKEHNVVSVYGADQVLKEMEFLSAGQFSTSSWFWVTADGKLLSHLVHGASDEKKIHTKNL